MKERQIPSPGVHDLRDALRLVLLFHRGGQWTDEDGQEWERITKGGNDATTKAMCDHIRKVLDE